MTEVIGRQLALPTCNDPGPNLTDLNGFFLLNASGTGRDNAGRQLPVDVSPTEPEFRSYKPVILGFGLIGMRFKLSGGTFTQAGRVCGVIIAKSNSYLGCDSDDGFEGDIVAVPTCHNGFVQYVLGNVFADGGVLTCKI